MSDLVSKRRELDVVLVEEQPRFRWRSIPLAVRAMFIVAGALFAMSLTMVTVQAQTTSSNTVCQPVALPLSGAETRAVNSEPTLNTDGRRAAFWSTANPVATNVDRSIEIFWANTSALSQTENLPIRQVTNSRGNILGGFNLMPDMMSFTGDGNVVRSFVVFASDRDYQGRNGDGGFEIFLAQMEPELRIWQLTETSESASLMPSISALTGDRYVTIAYLSDADADETRPKADNPDRNYEVHSMRVDLIALMAAPTAPVPIDNLFQLTKTAPPVATDPPVINDQPVISANGNKVVWLSNASSGIPVANTIANLDRNLEVFVTTVGANTMGVQVTKSTQGANDQPDINQDGTRITFVSTVTNYPTNGVFATSTLGPQSVYIARLTAAMQSTSVTGFSRISANVRAPVGRSVTAKEPAISDNGQRVVFAADGCDPAVTAAACNQPAGIYQVFVVDQLLSSPTAFTIARVTNAITRTHESPSVSGNGQRIALVTTQDAGVDNPDLSGSEIVALDCRLARLGATKQISTISDSLLENRPDVGDEVSFRVALSNTTFADFTGVMVMTDTMPQGLTYLGASVVLVPQGTTINLNPASFNPTTRRLIWTVTNLTKLNEAVIEIRARVNANQAGLTMVNRVNIGTTADTQAQGITNFEPETLEELRVTQVDLTANLAVSTQLPRETQLFTYTVAVENPRSRPPGSSGRAELMDPATGVVVTTTLNQLLDGELEYVSHSTTGVAQPANFNSATGVVTIPRIDGGQTASVRIVVRPRAGSGGQAPYTAAITGIRSQQEDINNANNVGTASRIIRVLGTDLESTRLTPSHNIPPQNTTISFKFDMRNLGPLPHPSNDPLYTANATTFVPAMVEARAVVPSGINVTAISDGGISAAASGGTEITWQIPGWSTTVTRTVAFTGVVVAAPGAQLTVSAGNLRAFFPPPESATMNDPVPANSGMISRTVRVNAPADVPVPIPDTIDEGKRIQLRVPYTDTDLLDTHVITVTWGDGSPSSNSGVLTRPPGSATGVYTFTHDYADDPPGINTSQYTIGIIVRDNNGNQVNVDAHVTVNNIPPRATAFNVTGDVFPPNAPPGTRVAIVGEQIQVTASFTDPGYSTAFSSETFTYLIKWPQDGIDSSGPVTTVTNGSFNTPTSGSIAVNKIFGAVAPASDVLVYVQDDDIDIGVNEIARFRMLVDQRPVARDDIEYFLEGDIKSVLPLLNDTDNNQASLDVISVNSTGAIGIVDFDNAANVVNYTAIIPDLSKDEVHTDTISYVVADNLGLTGTANIRFVVTGINDVPVVDLNGEGDGIDNSADFVEDAGPVILTTNGEIFDPDGDNEILSLVVTLMDEPHPEYARLDADLGPGSNVTMVWDDVALSLTFTKIDPSITPNWQAILRAVEYDNSHPNPEETPRTIGFIAFDAEGGSIPAETILSVTAVDDAPIITLTATPATADEGTPMLVDDAALIVDTDTLNWGGGALTVTVLSATALDHLRVASSGSISTTDNVDITYDGIPVASYTGYGGTQLVITFLPDVSVEIVQEIARRVEYLRASGVAEGNRTVRMTARSLPAGPVSNPAQRLINIVYTNDPPVITLTTPSLLEDTTANIRSNISIADSDVGGGNLRMTLNVSHGILQVSGIAGPNQGNGTATVVFTSTLAALNGGVIIYDPPDNFAGDATLTVTVNDLGNTGGLANNVVQPGTIVVTPVNDLPEVDLNGTNGAGTGTSVTFREGEGAVLLVEDDATITDVEDGPIVALTATVNVLNAGAEILSVNVGSTGIITSYNGTLGRLLLTGNRPIADYLQVLKTLRYNNTSNNPNTTPRSVQVVVRDADGGESAPAVASVTIQSFNDPPVLDLNGAGTGIDNAVTFVEDAGAVILPASGFTLVDPDSANLASATVLLTNRGAPANVESLIVTVPPTMTRNYDANSGLLTITGNASVATYRAILATVAYTNTNNAPNTGLIRQAEFTVTDSGGAVNAPKPKTLITVIATNDPSVLDLNGTGVTGTGFTNTFIEDQGAKPATDPLVAILDDDNDSPTYLTATVQIANLLDGALESLSLSSTPSGFTVNYTPATGLLLIQSNPARSVGDYQTVLANVRYNNTSQAPNTTTRTINFRIWDSVGVPSPIQAATMNVQSVNDAPQIVVSNPMPQVLEDTDINFSPHITVTDVDAGIGNIRVTLRVEHGTLTVGSGVQVQANGTAQVVITGTVTAIKAASITYRTVANYNGDETLTVNANDNGNTPGPPLSAAQLFRNFTVTAVDDVPVQTTNAGMNQTLSLGSSLPVTFTVTTATLQFTDPDPEPASEVVFTVTSLPTNGVLLRDGVPLAVCPAAPSTFTQQDINNNLIRYRLTTYTATVNTSFGFGIGNDPNCTTTPFTYAISIHP